MAALAAVHDTPRQQQAPTPESDLGAALRWVRGAVRRRSQVVVISDFLDAGTWDKQLRLLALHHDVVTVHVTDPREMAIPDVGILAVVDTETGRQRYVNTSTPGLRQRYAEAAEKRAASIRSTIHATGAEYLPLSTGRDWLTDTVRFATTRRTVRSSGARTTSSTGAPAPAPAPRMAQR